MGLEASRHVILSSGGKLGAGGTILRGQAVPESVAQYLPLDAVSGAPAPPPRQAVRPAPAVAPSAPVAPVEPAGSEVPPVTAEPTSSTTSKAAEEPAIPTSRAKLKAMSKDAVVRVCRELGLTFADDAPEKEIRDRLARELELK